MNGISKEDFIARAIEHEARIQKLIPQIATVTVAFGGNSDVAKLMNKEMEEEKAAAKRCRWLASLNANYRARVLRERLA